MPAALVSLLARLAHLLQGCDRSCVVCRHFKEARYISAAAHHRHVGMLTVHGTHLLPLKIYSLLRCVAGMRPYRKLQRVRCICARAAVLCAGYFRVADNHGVQGPGAGVSGGIEVARLGN